MASRRIVALVVTDAALLPWDSLADCRGLVMAKENRVVPAQSGAVWATAKHEAAITEFAASGGAVIGLHNGLASYDETGRYFQTVRGCFQFHPKEHPLCFTPGHSDEVLNNPAYLGVLERGLRWALRLEQAGNR